MHSISALLCNPSTERREEDSRTATLVEWEMESQRMEDSTEHFTNLGPQKPLNNVSELHKLDESPDFKAVKCLVGETLSIIDTGRPRFSTSIMSSISMESHISCSS